MSIKFGKKKYRQHYIVHTVIAVLLICVVFLGLVSYLYTTTHEEAYENLHVQTKQIKDDLILQMVSDRENLATMANFAAKLYADGENYDLIFSSFKSIGLIENIGILKQDNVFVTKAGQIDLSGRISFAEEAGKVPYISGRVMDVTRDNYENIRSAVPIKLGGKTVGILYGVIKLTKIEERYDTMAKDINAQLFVYDKEKGDLVIDTIHDELGNISFLKDRVYNKNYSYEQFRATTKGFVSFVSKYTGENMHMHYSDIEELGWVIALARYDSQVFAQTHKLSRMLLLIFCIMVGIMALYILLLLGGERRTGAVNASAAEIRKTLLESSGEEDHILKALRQVCEFADARSALFFDTDGEMYHHVSPTYKGAVLGDEDKKYFMSELFTYAADLHAHNSQTVNVLCIKPNKHLLKTNPEFYNFMKSRKIKEVAMAAVINHANHIVVFGVLNAKHSVAARMLGEKIAVCFSIAIHNKNHLNRTELAATTDALTGALNRVAYKNDLNIFDRECAQNFSCIYFDVNELHLINNKYGHAAGDEMLLYIANTLKEVFCNHRIYRMGGDEFLVFAKGLLPDEIKEYIAVFEERIEPRNYHVAIGTSFRAQNTDAEEMVKEAEVRMYEAKAQFYQNKEIKRVNDGDAEKEYVNIQTGIAEIDTMLSILKEHYHGIYRVSLTTDKASRILMPSYLGYNESETGFSTLYCKYVNETVDPDYRRAMEGFLNYDAIRKQLMAGNVPKITYKKNGGEDVILRVYKLRETEEIAEDTLWVFERA